MHFTSSLVLSLPLLVSAAPARRATTQQNIDPNILQFAFVLEQLETTFYTEALKKFSEQDFISAGFNPAAIPAEQFQTILSDESTHTSVLNQAILDAGAQPLTTCQFDFSKVLTDVATMAATARVVEMVGVGAYLGAASLVTDPQILTAAASILTVEARHSSILNLLSGTGTAVPQAFDIPLSPPQVLAIAGGFIANPQDCNLGINANTPLTITTQGVPTTGTKLEFDLSALNGADTSQFTCQMLVGGAPTAIALALDQCIVPPNINGPVAIFVVNTQQPLANSQLVQFSSSIMLGPTLAFIDIQPQTLGQLAHNTGASINSTNFVTPSEASSVASSGSAESTSSAGEGSSTSTSSAGEASATGTGETSSSASGESNGESSTSASGESSASSTEASASSTASAESSSQSAGVDNAASAPAISAISGGPNFTTGPSGDGHTVVEGWKNLPPGVSPPS